MTSGARHPLFWSVLLGVVVLDIITKHLAVAKLGRLPVAVLGETVQFRLVYNPGAAFGLYLGPYSRWIFMTLAVVALIVLGSMVARTPPHQWIRLSSLALVCGGAVGNLIDRIRSARGVVDFIDVYIGPLHWPTFNVADMAVSVGAVTLALILWREGEEPERSSARASAEEAGPAGA